MKHTNHQPAGRDVLKDFLNRAERDASARAGDPFGRTALTTAFAEALNSA